MSKCYLSGPMRGLPEYNYPAFISAANYLRSLGWHVFNPAEMDIAEADDDNLQAHTLEEQKLRDTASNARRFARRDVDILLDVLKSEDGDCVFILPGCDSSVGATAEIAMAKWLFLPVIPYEDARRPGELTSK